MSETAEFPLPADVTADERATVSREFGKHVTIADEAPDRIRFEGRLIGQTGPNWHFQYTRMYQLPTGFLAAGHDLREGIVVVHAESVDKLGEGFANAGVREFIEDELRFRGHLKSHAAA